MSAYSRLLRQRIAKYEGLYAKNPKKFAQKLIWWNFRWLFKRENKSLYKDTINIAIRLNGGIGDILIQNTYVKELKKHLATEKIIIDIFGFDDELMPHALFHQANYVDHVFSNKQYGKRKRDYDLILNIQRFVSVDYANSEKIKKLSKKLHDYTEKITDFAQKNSFIVENSPYSDHLSTQLAIFKNKNRVNQPDILNILQLSKDPINFIELNAQYLGVLNKFELSNKKYITIQRGINHNDKAKESVRNWPVHYYEKLIALLKTNYPQIMIVQLGYSKAHCELLEGVDLDLRGETNLEELKIILKDAILHIDYEGGYPHIRHFLNAPSVVLFGPTDLDFYGYPENINIKSDGCHLACEWVTATWSSQCARGFTEPPCMYNILPETVYPKIKQFLDQLPEYTYKTTQVVQAQENIVSYLENLLASANSCGTIHYEFAQIKTLGLEHLLTNTHKLGLNVLRNPAIEYSGKYNVAAKKETFDLIFARVEEDELFPTRIIAELLRTMTKDGKLLLYYPGAHSEKIKWLQLSANLTETNRSYFLLEKHYD